MKALNRYRENWEAENLIKFNILKEKAGLNLLKLVKSLIDFLSFSFFLFWNAGKYLILILKVIFLSENEIRRIERDENWIFRHFK